MTNSTLDADEIAVVIDEPSETVQTESSDSAPRPMPRVRGWRRFLRFNLLTFLVAFLVLTTYLGLRQRFVVSSAEHTAAAKLAEKGAQLVYVPAGSPWMQYALLQFGDDFRHVQSVTLMVDSTPPTVPPPRLPDDWLAELPALARLESFDANGQRLADAAIAPLAKCATLRHLDLSNTEVSDAGIESLRHLRDLRSINIAETLTSDAALEALADLPELIEISVDDSTGERGIAALSRFPKLRQVDASSTRLLPQDFESLPSRSLRVAYGPAIVAEDYDFDEDYATGGVTVRRSSWFEPGAVRIMVPDGTAFDPALISRLDKTNDTIAIVFEGGGSPTAETVAALIVDPRVVAIELAGAGSPVAYREIVEMQSARPADARPCRVHGQVLTSGDELAAEIARPQLSYNPFYCRGYSRFSFPICNLDAARRTQLEAAGVTFHGDEAMCWGSPATQPTSEVLITAGAP